MAIENSVTAATTTSDIFASKLQTATTDESNAMLFADLMNASQVAVDASTAITSQSLAVESAGSESTEDKFLTLLLAQMNNQDPLNPLENAEVTTQLAQISTVSGIEDMNKTMSELLSRIGASSPVDAAAMIDRQVLVSGDKLEVTGESDQKLTGGAELLTGATDVVAQVFGSDGEAVRDIALGPQPAGQLTFEWDGLDDSGDEVDEGSYQFRVVSLSGGEQQIAAPMIASTVTGITRSGESISYRLANGTVIPADQVSSVF